MISLKLNRGYSVITFPSLNALSTMTCLWSKFFRSWRPASDWHEAVLDRLKQGRHDWSSLHLYQVLNGKAASNPSPSHTHTHAPPHLAAVLKLTSFMSWRSSRNGMGEGRQRVSSAHWEPLSYMSSIWMFVSLSNGCQRSFSTLPHSQNACVCVYICPFTRTRSLFYFLSFKGSNYYKDHRLFSWAVTDHKNAKSKHPPKFSSVR